MIDGKAVNDMYVGQTSAKLIGGGYNVIPMDMNVGGPQSLMMDQSVDCVSVNLLPSNFYYKRRGLLAMQSSQSTSHTLVSYVLATPDTRVVLRPL